MTSPSNSDVQNLLPVQAYFNLDGSFNTFIGQGNPFYATANPSQSGLSITNSTINSTTIGATTPSTGVFTNIATTTGTIATAATGPTDIVNKQYVDYFAAGLSWKQPALTATSANITLSGLQTINGVTLVAGDIVLVKDQTNAAQNGIYVASATAWTYSVGGDTWNEYIGAIIFITSGALNGTAWYCTAQPGGTLGVTALNWSNFSVASSFTAGTGLTLTGTVFSITNTGVTANTYGSATASAVIAVNAQGQITSASNSTITPAVGSITGLGTGVATALAVNTGSAGAFVVNGGAIGTPTSGDFSTGTFTWPTFNQNTTGYAAGLAGGAAGSLPYQTALNTTGFLAAGTNGQVLTLAAGVPSWATLSSSAVTTFSGGTTGLTPATATSGAITLGGTLVVSNGGTGLSSLATGYIPYGNGTGALSSSAALNYTSSVLFTPGASLTANLEFTGTGNRIRGDFSNATATNRVIFQTSTTNSNTVLTVIPNGTATGVNSQFCNNSDPTNSSVSQFVINATEASIRSAILGTGTYLPLTMYTGGSERLRIDTSGNVGIGGANDTFYGKLQVLGSGNQALSVKSTDASGVVALLAANASTDARVGSFSNHPLVFYTNSTERMRITSSGGVSFGSSGTAFGSSGQILNSNGDAAPTWINQSSIAAGSATNATNVAIIDDTTTATTVYPVWSNNTSGNQALETSSTKLSFVPSTGVLTATTFSGAGTSLTGTGSSFTAGTANALATGNNYQVNSLGVGTAGSGTAGEIRATNNITAYFSSDKQFKENIKDIENALDKVKAIGGKEFDWTDNYVAEKGGADGYFIQKQDFGVIAQDVQSVFPKAVRTREDGTLAVDYSKLVALAFAAIVELKAEINQLKGN
jgi:hypothetical protein